MIKFRNLKPEEIDVKIGAITKSGYTLLLYKNARVDMAILDETVGAENWQNKFYEVCGNLYCSVGINVNYDKDEAPLWVWKDDCGVESDFGDKEKGQASDARKRAGFAWGIGRALYTNINARIYCETIADGKSYRVVNDDDKWRKYYVAKIEYDGEKIVELTIVDNQGTVWFDLKNGAKKVENAPAAPAKPKQDEILGGEYILPGGKYKGLTIDAVYRTDASYIDFCATSDKVGANLKKNIQKFLEDEANGTD